jgi:hypothetical protein
LVLVCLAEQHCKLGIAFVENVGPRSARATRGEQESDEMGKLLRAASIPLAALLIAITNAASNDFLRENLWIGWLAAGLIVLAGLLRVGRRWMYFLFPLGVAALVFLLSILSDYRLAADAFGRRPDLNEAVMWVISVKWREYEPNGPYFLSLNILFFVASYVAGWLYGTWSMRLPSAVTSIVESSKKSLDQPVQRTLTGLWRTQKLWIILGGIILVAFVSDPSDFSIPSAILIIVIAACCRAGWRRRKPRETEKEAQRVSPESRPQSEPSLLTAGEAIFCAQCGKAIAGQNSFCTNCGAGNTFETIMARPKQIPETASTKHSEAKPAVTEPSASVSGPATNLAAAPTNPVSQSAFKTPYWTKRFWIAAVIAIVVGCIAWNIWPGYRYGKAAPWLTGQSMRGVLVRVDRINKAAYWCNMDTSEPPPEVPGWGCKWVFIPFSSHWDGNTLVVEDDEWQRRDREQWEHDHNIVPSDVVTPSGRVAVLAHALLPDSDAMLELTYDQGLYFVLVRPEVEGGVGKSLSISEWSEQCARYYDCKVRLMNDYEVLAPMQRGVVRGFCQRGVSIYNRLPEPDSLCGRPSSEQQTGGGTSGSNTATVQAAARRRAYEEILGSDPIQSGLADLDARGGVVYAFFTSSATSKLNLKLALAFDQFSYELHHSNQLVIVVRPDIETGAVSAVYSIPEWLTYSAEIGGGKVSVLEYQPGGLDSQNRAKEAVVQAFCQSGLTLYDKPDSSELIPDCQGAPVPSPAPVIAAQPAVEPRSAPWPEPLKATVEGTEATATNYESFVPTGKLLSRSSVGEYEIQLYNSVGVTAGMSLEILKKGKRVFGDRMEGEGGIAVPDTIPPGKDITGNGVPDLIVSEYGGGSHCCATYYVFELGTEFREIAQFGGLDGEADARQFQDLLHEGHLEFVSDLWHGEKVFAFHNGSYRPAVELMRKSAPTQAALVAEANRIRNSGDWKDPQDLSLGVYGYGPEFRGKPTPDLAMYTLPLVDSGHANLAFQFVEMAWPTGRAGKEEFVEDLRRCIDDDPELRALNAGTNQ